VKTGSIELREESEALVTQLTASANRTFFAYLMLPLASVTTDLYVRSWPFSARGSQFWGRTDTDQVDALIRTAAQRLRTSMVRTLSFGE